MAYSFNQAKEQTMKIEVEMLAFEDGRVREVDIPDTEWAEAKDVEQQLGLIFQYGQNDFQPKPMCSVSVGDVVSLDGKKYKVAGIGWVELNGHSYNKYLAIPRKDRYFAFEQTPGFNSSSVRLAE
jgi:hypothetical protein